MTLPRKTRVGGGVRRKEKTHVAMFTEYEVRLLFEVATGVFNPVKLAKRVRSGTARAAIACAPVAGSRETRRRTRTCTALLRCSRCPI